MGILKILSIPLVGLMLYGVVPTKSESEPSYVKEDRVVAQNNEVSSVQGREALNEVVTLISKVGQDEGLYTNKEKYDSVVNQLLEKLPVLAQANEVKVGDNIDQSFLGFELQKANEKVQELRDYIDNLPEYQEPMSADELNALLSE